ncbi:hypothetical protein FQA39_LY06456 [Lamprigera yunnana]|nr:hypothetical protein FQA39_LY06456 [Lamprigera yunnana]
MTRRNLEELSANSSSPLDSDGTIMSPPPPQASPADRSPMRDAPSSPAMLATMTPVNALELKKEMEEKRAMGHSPLYAQVKTEIMYEKDDELYAHGVHDKNDAPIDLIYEDGNKTVIYTTTPHQKGLEMYSSDNSGEITINSINAHHIQGSQIADVLIDGNSGTTMVTTGNASGSPPATVSVVLQGNGQGLLQYPQTQVPGTTVLFVSELVDDMELPIVGLSYYATSGTELTHTESIQ